MKLSIIIPYYNAEPYTSELLDVLAPQVTDQVEVIVVDDGSRQPFKTDHQFCRVIRKENGGTASARNRGLDEARGDYIQFIDADDLVPDYYVKKIFAKIKSSDADVIDFSWRSLDRSGAWADLRLIEDKTFLTNPSACTRCFKRSFIGAMRFNENKDTTEDEDFSRRLGYLFQDLPIKRASMAEYMYYYRTGVVNSQSKKFQKGLKRTKRYVYYFNHVTSDMTYLMDEFKQLDQSNEVRLMTNQCDLPELRRYCLIQKPRKMWAHYARGEKTSLIQIEAIPVKYDIVMYCEKLNRVGGITSFLYYWIQSFRKEYKILLLYDRMDEMQLHRFRKMIDVLQNSPNRPIMCDTLIINRLTDKIPKNVSYKKTIQVCHACRQQELRIPRGRDYLVNVSEYAKSTWGPEAAGGIVIHNIVHKSTEKPLMLVSATRVGAPDKGDNDQRFRTLANMMNNAGIPFIWFNFSDKPLPNPPRNFINIDARVDVQGFMQMADYVVQLSTYEACSMTVQEALINNTPLICCPVPSFKEQGVEDGVNAHVIPFDMSFDVNILRDVPSFGYVQDTESIKAKWRKLLAAEPRPSKTVLVKVTRKYKDLMLGREIFAGSTMELEKDRADFLEKELKVVDIIG